MLDVYKKIKNNDIDFLLEDDEDSEDGPDTSDIDTDFAEADDGFAADYDEDDEDDE